MKPSETLRPEVAAFALAMEQKLRENDHKGGWKECSFSYLIKRLRDEVGELVDAVSRKGEGWPPGKFVREAADVANFAMMIADVAGEVIPSASALGQGQEGKVPESPSALPTPTPPQGEGLRCLHADLKTCSDGTVACRDCGADSFDMMGELVERHPIGGHGRPRAPQGEAPPDNPCPDHTRPRAWCSMCNPASPTEGR